MNKQDTFLIEIGTEELPTQIIESLPNMLSDRLKEQFIKEDFSSGKIELFATPRRFAVLIHDVDSLQKDKIIERKGPSLTIALDKKNKPTAAGLGFARACGVNFEDLEMPTSTENASLIYRSEQKGKTFIELAPSMVQTAIKSLTLGKTMRWNTFDTEFLRPVHWVLLMYGNQLISTEILNVATDKKTFGHRFHHPAPIILEHANQYESRLENIGNVIASFDKRKERIISAIQQIASEKNAQIVFNEKLINEITSLVEWPFPYIANYSETFLTLPKEILTSAIETHQKCFPIENKNGTLQPYFITIGNIHSALPEKVILGNERVMRARLSDAAFFFDTDKKHSLQAYLKNLKNVSFQEKLGSLFDKTTRLSALSVWVAQQSTQTFDSTELMRAGLLSKADLVTDIVREFPELQGLAGYYYAIHDKEKLATATAIREHYFPKFSGDILPSTLAGSALAIADRIDNLVGMFSLNRIPSGDKDPFGLKRASLGIIRILIEAEFAISLSELIEQSVHHYGSLIKNTDFIPTLHTFIIERLRAWYHEKGISSDSFNAVTTIQKDVPLDIHHRMMAVENFRRLPQAQTLTLANKRVSNILDQAGFIASPGIALNPGLFETDAEKHLYHQIQQLQKSHEQNYTERLTELAQLHTFVDSFFDTVMVMAPNLDIRNNRLQLLNQLRGLFLQIADISLLQM
jgi:glycyl-tRNA synthetase beta chain